MEPSKAGIPVEEVKAMIESMITFDNIRLRGLMAIPAPNDNPVAQRDAFRRLRELQESVKQTFDIIEFDQLSMGMTADLESAIAEGSTILRIGTAIFGARE
jgi:pyridoxal phosphate enzyme (YggS family)